MESMTIEISDQFVMAELAARASRAGRSPETEALYILQCVLHSVGMTSSCPGCAGGFADDEDNTWLMELWNSWSFVDELPESEVHKKIAEKEAFFDTLFRGEERT
jgi:hypothetical protein